MNTGKTLWKLGHTPWNKGMIGLVLKPKTGWSIICIVCGNSKYYQLWEHKRRKRIYCSPKCYHKNSRKEKLTYSGIHARILRDWGKADVCEVCGSTKTVDWANISGQYLLNKADWNKLCRKCHIAFDKGKNDLAFKNFSLRR